MKRFLILFTAVGLLAGLMANAEAKKPQKRVERNVEGTYDTQFVPFSGLVTASCANADAVGCVIIDTQPNEAFFTAKVVDAHGQPVLVTVTNTGSPESGPDRTYGTFCGETEGPIAFDRGEKLKFWPGYWDPWLPTNWPSCPPGFGTTGTISVTLSNLEHVTLSNPEHVPPARSGSILTGTGWFLDYQTGGCQVSPECAAWVQNNCSEALVGHDPGLTASIIDVDVLADAPPIERVFRFGVDDPAGLVWGGVQLQFWNSDCVEIRDKRWLSTDCDGDASGRDCTRLRFLMPPTAKWMTVTGYEDNANLAWTLS